MLAVVAPIPEGYPQKPINYGFQKPPVVYTLQWPHWGSEALFPLSFHNDVTVNISPCADHCP